MAASFDFYFDFASSYTYLAYTQIADFAKKNDAEVRWRPFLLGGVFKALDTKPPINIPQKGVYLLADCNRWAEHYGVPFNFPPTFPVNTLRAMRGAIHAERAGRGDAYRDACFRAMWVDGVDLGDVEAVADLAAGAGLDRAGFLAAVEDPAIKQELMDATTGAVDRGVFGAPTFFVGDQMFWGNDRLDFVAAALAASR